MENVKQISGNGQQQINIEYVQIATTIGDRAIKIYALGKEIMELMGDAVAAVKRFEREKQNKQNQNAQTMPPPVTPQSSEIQSPPPAAS